jgi:hypothetical protein
MKEKEDGCPMTTVGDDGGGMADQLAESILSQVEGLRQGLPVDEGVRPRGQSAGVSQKEGECCIADYMENIFYVDRGSFVKMVV